MRTPREGIGRFAIDERGAILPLVAMFLTVLMGLSFLMVDLSRFVNLQTQLQKAADAFALAAAAELDGRPAVAGRGDAISRADQAIDAMLAGLNSSRWGAAVTVASRRYLSALPATDSQPIGAGLVTNNPREARFVEVVVAPVSITPAISARLVGMQVDTLTTSAVAVAGFNESVCRFTPVYICNPMEGDPSGMTIWEAAADPAFQRRELTLKQGPHTTSSCPGNFGFLSAGDNGANALRNALAAINPGACYSRSRVTTQPGNITSASDALNTRFGIYERSANGMANAAYPPAENVRKGYYNDPNGCRQTQWVDPVTGQIPTTCTAATCPYRGFTADFQPNQTTLCGGSIGDGLWDVEGYWAVNHSAAPLPAGWSNANPPSRRQVYLYEIANGLVNDASNGGQRWNPPKGPQKDPERGGPTCNAPGVSNPDRRIMYGAIINCQANAAAFNGRATDLPVEAFGEFFLTRPVNKDDNTIYAELTGIVRPGDGSGVVHDDVQLYR